MKKVRVTKTAVIIEAMMPMIRVTAKPLTGPVPNWNRKSAVSTVLTFESTMAFMACLKPSSIASRTVLPQHQLLADPLEDQHVGVHRDADREHDAREPGQGERGVDHREPAQREQDVERQGRDREHAAQPVEPHHDQDDERGARRRRP